MRTLDDLDPEGKRVLVAQTMHEAAEGAFTGEVSPPMPAEVGPHGGALVGGAGLHPDSFARIVDVAHGLAGVAP